MSSEADVLGKLSRIFETHAFSRDNPDYELDEILDDLDPLDQSPYMARGSSPGRQFKKRFATCRLFYLTSCHRIKFVILFLQYFISQYGR